MAKPTEDKDINLPDSLIRDLLTESEIRMIKQRYLILALLQENLSVRAIAARVGVGTDTVVRINRLAESRNLKPASTKKRKVSKNEKTLPNTSWIFGKTE